MQHVWVLSLILLFISCEKEILLDDFNSSSSSPNTSLPTVLASIDPPAVGINSSNSNAYPISGTCSEEGTSNIDISINSAITQVIDCNPGGTFSTTIDLSSFPDNSIEIGILHSGSRGGTSLDTESISKDTTAPTIAIDSAPIINDSNKSSYTFSGSCSDIGENVSYDIASGAIAGSTLCNVGNLWSATIDATSVADNSVITILADHVDEVGNTAAQASRNTNKDTVSPVVTISTAATINIANTSSYNLAGTCSDSGNDVSYSVASLSGTTACDGTNNWNLNLDLTTVSDNSALSINISHLDASGNTISNSVDVLKDTVRPNPLSVTTPSNGAVLSSTSQTITGSCENNSSVVINGSGLVAAPVSGSCNSSGSYSIAVTLTSGDGVKSISVNQTDSAGNSMSAPLSASYTLDTSIPTVAITSFTTMNLANVASYNFSGTCSENGQNVSYNLNGITGSTACSSNTWSASENASALTDSLNLPITANHSDSASNSAVQSSVSILKDTVRPTTLSLLSPADASTVSSTAFNISGACEANSDLSVSGSGLSTSASGTCDGAGNYNLAISLTSGDGVKNFNLNQTDAAGNPMASASSFSFTLDTSVPSVTILSSSVINIANVASYSLNGACSEPSEDVNYNIGGISGTVTCSVGNTWNATADLTTVSDATSVAISADHDDSVGNSAPQATLSVLKDTVRPTVLSLSSPADSSILNATTQTISGSCEANADLNVSGSGLASAVTGTCSGAGAYSLAISLSSGDGVKSFSINETDTAGNTIAAPLSASYTLDTAIPTIAITSSPIANIANVGSYTLSGTCSENSQDILYNIGSISGSVSCSANTWSATEDISSVSDNSAVVVTANHSDAATNSATQASVNILKDTVRPTVLTLATPANNSALANTSVTMTGSCEADANVVISGAGISSSASGTCTSGGAYSISATLTSGDGVKAYSIDQTDAAGNAMTSPISGSYTLDTAAPTITIASSPIINLSNHTSYTISGACSESSQDVSYNIGGVTGTVSCSSNSWLATADVNTVGDSTSLAITVDHSDAATNPATQATAAVVKDTIRPTPLTLTTPAASTELNSTSQTMAGTCEANANVVISGAGITGSPSQTCTGGGSYSIAVTLTSGDGAKAYSIDQTDAAGNAMASPISGSYTLDTAIPSVAITSSTVINLANHTSYILSGTCSENSQDVSFNIGGVTGTTNCLSNEWSASTDVNTASDSLTLAITADHVDAAGNSAIQSSLNVLKDTIRPTPLSLASPANASSVSSTSQTMTGSCETDANVVISGAGITGSPSQTCASSAYSIAVTLTAGAGSKSYSIDQTDVAGNSMASPVTGSYTLEDDDIVLTNNVGFNTPAVSTVHNFNFETSGDNRLLIVVMACHNDGDMSNVTYNGAALTELVTQKRGTGLMGSLWYLVNPDLGTNQVSMTFGGTATNQCTTAAYNFKNVSQLNPLGTHQSGVNGSTANYNIPLNLEASDKGFALAVNRDDVASNFATTSSGGRDSVIVPTDGGGGSGLDYTIEREDDLSTDSRLTAIVGIFSGEGDIDPEFDTGDNANLYISVPIKKSVPFVTISSYPHINSSNENLYSFGGNCTEETQDISYNIGGITGTVVCSSGVWSDSVNVSSLSNSSNPEVADIVITADHSSGSGENAAQATQTIIKDTNAPGAGSLTLSSPVAASTVYERMFNMSGNCETGRTVEISGIGMNSVYDMICSAGSYSIPVTLTAGDGVKDFTVDQVDTAGNRMDTPLTWSYTLLERSIALNGLANITPSNVNSYNLSGTCSPAGTNVIRLTIGGTSFSSRDCLSNGTWIANNLNTSSVSDSTSLSVDVSYSNTISDSASIIKDTVAPTTPSSISPSSGSTIISSTTTVTGSCENAATISVTGADLASPPYTAVCSSSSFSVAITFNGGNGSKSFSLNQSDSVGNQSPNFNGTLTVDNTYAPRVIGSNSLESPNNNGHRKASYSITSSGTNRLLLVHIAERQSFSLRGEVTYAGRKMKRLEKSVGSFGSGGIYVYYQLEPELGTNDLIIENDNDVDIQYFFLDNINLANPFGSVSKDSGVEPVSTNLTINDDQVGIHLIDSSSLNNDQFIESSPAADTKFRHDASGAGTQTVQTFFHNPTVGSSRTLDPVFTNSNISGDRITVISYSVNKFETRNTVTAISSPKANGSYSAGENIDIEISFSDSATVNTASGTPYLELDTGFVKSKASYISGSGTSTLTFRYTASGMDRSSDLDYTSISALELNNGSILDSSGDEINLLLPQEGSLASLSGVKNIAILPTLPTIDFLENIEETDSRRLTGTTESFGVDIQGTDRLLLITTSCDGSYQVTSMSYAGSNLVLLANEANGFETRNQFFYMINPPTGSNTLTINNPSRVSRCSHRVINLNNVDQATPFGSYTTGISASSTTSTTTALSTTTSQIGISTFVFGIDPQGDSSFGGSPEISSNHNYATGDETGYAIYTGNGTIDPIINHRSINRSILWLNVPINVAP